MLEQRARQGQAEREALLVRHNLARGLEHADHAHAVKGKDALFPGQVETRRDLKPDFRLPLKALFVEFARLLDFLALEGLVLLLGAPGGLEVHQGRRYVFPVRALGAVEAHPVSAHVVALHDLIGAVLEKELDVGPSHAWPGQHTTKAQRNQEQRHSAAQPHHAKTLRGLDATAGPINSAIQCANLGRQSEAGRGGSACRGGFACLVRQSM